MGIDEVAQYVAHHFVVIGNEDSRRHGRLRSNAAERRVARAVKLHSLYTCCDKARKSGQNPTQRETVLYEEGVRGAETTLRGFSC
jgi:hypothetical protein